MMPNLNNWLSQADGSGTGISIADRAVDAWRRINDNPAMVHSIVIRRNGSKLAAQIFRVEFEAGAKEISKPDEANAELFQLACTIFGVVGHPSESIPDANIRVDDEFGIDGVIYYVKAVLPYAGEIQAMAYRKA